MKRFFRSRIAQGILSRLVAGYVELTIATLRWRFENRGPVDLAMAAPEGLIALFWHGRIAQGMACRPLLGGKARRVMVSLSPDGEFMAMAAQRLKIPSIRGSAGKVAEASSKRGVAAFREALSFIRRGGVMIVTPDGPRGPAQVLPLGPLLLAQAAGCPVFVMSLAAHPAIVLRSWDRASIPLPFARARVVLDGPWRVPAAAAAVSLEALRVAWQDRMRAGQARAESLLDGSAA